MSLSNNLLLINESVHNAAGKIPRSGDGSTLDIRKALIPPGHTTLPTLLTLGVNENGEILRLLREKQTIVIPCTESSMGRTIKPVPHPLFDQLQYLDLHFDKEKTSMYLEQLAAWKGDNVKLNAIYRCVSEHSISEEAARFNVEITEKDRKAGVCFEVEIGLQNSDVSNDPDIQAQWISYLYHDRQKKGKDMFGEDLYAPILNFPKKIVSVNGNAKLLSANDSTNFTYRGRFASKEEALQVDGETSQKIHSTLQWLVNNHGTITDTQAIVICSVKNPNEKPKLDPQEGSYDFGSLFSSDVDEPEAPRNDIADALTATNFQYAQVFSKVLRGYGNANKLKKHADLMMIVILDAATSGRLSVTYYRELSKDEYVESILRWHVDAAWPLKMYDKEKKKFVAYEGAPSFADIISCAYDVSDRSSKAYKRFAKNTKKQLIECMFGGESLPRFILDATYHRVTKPMGYDAPGAWLRDFEIACSLWKKHYIDDARKQNKQEDTISMYLEPTRNDRDYLYGRLLALADRFENGVLYKQGISDTRPTNAVKLMSNFVAKPFTTWGTLWKQLMPYLKSANGAPWFQNSVDEVMALFKEGDFEDNRALSPLFLLGYSCQRRESMRKAQEASQKSKEN